jgi:hypothetical protein
MTVDRYPYTEKERKRNTVALEGRKERKKERDVIADT